MLSLRKPGSVSRIDALLIPSNDISGMTEDLLIMIVRSTLALISPSS